MFFEWKNEKKKRYRSVRKVIVVFFVRFFRLSWWKRCEKILFFLLVVSMEIFFELFVCRD